MVSQVKAFILAVVLLWVFFGYATLGPFTDLERQKAFDSYQTLIEDTVREQLERISSFTGEHTVVMTHWFSRALTMPIRILRVTTWCWK